MRTTMSHPRGSRALVLVSLLAVLGVGACSSNNSPTSPYGGGGNPGGGGPGAMFNFGPFAVGQSAKFAFASAGTFGYHCIPHQSMGMIGSVTVDPAGSDSMVVQIGMSNGLTFSPSAAHIKPGGYVRWVNVSSLTIHTVTSN